MTIKNIPAIREKEAIAKAKAEIDSITSNEEAPTFENTLEALEFAGETLSRVSSIFFNLNSAETNEEIQQIAQEVSPWLSEFSNDLTLNEELFKRVKAVYEQKESLDLTVEQKTLLDKHYKSFTRNGANLPEDKKQKLREIDKELSKLSLSFGENVLAETNRYELHIEDESELKGLPESELENANLLAKAKGKSGYIFTLQYPSYIPFMKYAENRELRKKLAIAFGAKGFQNDEYDNQENVLKIAKLRHERAPGIPATPGAGTVSTPRGVYDESSRQHRATSQQHLLPSTFWPSSASSGSSWMQDCEASARLSR